MNKKIPTYVVVDEKGLGGLIGGGVGAIAGSFLGNPALGAKLGQVGGNLVEGAIQGKPEQPKPPVNYAASSYGYAQGGAIMPMGQDAIQFNGPSHESGGIQIPGAEVEGEETMDFINFKGGKIIDSRDGSPYIFSKRLKLPDSSATFAQAHKRLVKKNANEDEIRQLAMLQEKVSGRTRSSENDMQAPTTGERRASVSPKSYAQTSAKQYAQTSKKTYAKANDFAMGGAVDPDPPSDLFSMFMQPFNAGQENGTMLYTNSPASPREYDFTGGYQNGPLGNEPMTNIEKSNILTPLGYNLKGQNIRNLIEPSQPKGNTSSDAPTVPKASNQTVTPEDPTTDPLNIERATVPASASLSDPIQSGPLQYAGTPGINGSAPSPEASTGVEGIATGGQEGGFGASQALQFVPEILNFATGALSNPEAPEATKVSNRAVDNFPTRVNVNPQLRRNAANYRAILADPNATVQEKLAAQGQKQIADSRIFGEKINRENRLKANRSRIQASIDRTNAGFSNQRRTEQAQIDANFGPTGNIARGAVASAAQKMLLQQAQSNQQDRNEQATLAIISQLDPALQEKYIKQLGLLQ